MRFVSYAQNLEDMIIFNALKDYVQVGNYIDVGANDPVKYSVTKAFYDRGWSGINVEPLSDMCAYLEAERSRDINLCLGVGAKEGVLRLQKMGMGSSFAADIQEQNSGITDFEEKLILPLQNIYDGYVSPGSDIHFCKIDVEGFEKEVLQGIDFTRMRPWIFVMEATEPGTTIPCHEKWESILLENGYILAFTYGINRYYVAQEKAFLAEEFKKTKQFALNNELFICNAERVTVS